MDVLKSRHFNSALDLFYGLNIFFVDQVIFKNHYIYFFALYKRCQILFSAQSSTCKIKMKLASSILAYICLADESRNEPGLLDYYKITDGRRSTERDIEMNSCL